MKKILFLLFLPLNLLAIDPEKEYSLTPDSIGWEYEELIITTEDGYDLNTWVYAPNLAVQKDEVLILAYPDAGNMSYFVYQASILANLGYTVITFDYRGFGKSSDFDIKSDYLFQTEFSIDIKAIVDFATRRFENENIGIWAWSMGTMVTTNAWDQINQDVEFLIFDAFVINPKDHIERLKSVKNKETYSPIDHQIYINKRNEIDVPILLFAGKDDQLTTTQDAKSFVDNFDNTAKIAPYDGGHLMGFQQEINELGFGGWYSNHIDNFLNDLNEQTK